MLVLMHKEATPQQAAAVMEVIEGRGLTALSMPGGTHTAIGIPIAIPPEMRERLASSLAVMAGVDHIVHVSRPFKLASREFHSASTIVTVKGVEIGGTPCGIMAGLPCPAYHHQKISPPARAAKKHGTILPCRAHTTT